MPTWPVLYRFSPYDKYPRADRSFVSLIEPADVPLHILSTWVSPSSRGYWNTNRLVWFAVGYLIVVAVLIGFASSLGATIGVTGELSLVLILSFVIEGIAYAFYHGWRSVFRGWKSEIGRARGSAESLPSLSRELGVMEIAVRSLRLYKDRFAVFLIPFVGFGLAIGLLDLGIQTYLPIQLSQYASPLGGIIEPPSVVIQSVMNTAVLSPINALVDGIGVSIVVGYLDHRNSDLKGSYLVARSKFRQLWYVVILTGVVADLAFIIELAGFIPEIIFFVVIPVVVIEGKPTLGVLKRSWQMVNKRWTAVFELFVVAGLLAGLPFLIITLVTGFEGPIETLTLGLYSGIVSPILICMSTVFYYSSVARLSAPPPGDSVPSSQGIVSLWVCKNCGTSTHTAFTPSPTAFGGCLKSKRGWLESIGKHDWEASPAGSSTSQKRYCANCGNSLGLTDVFCTSCGRSVA